MRYMIAPVVGAAVLAEGGEAPLGAIILNGNLALATFPGEFFVEFQQDLKRRSPIRDTFFLGYASEAFAYFPTLKAVSEGGYRASVNSFVAPGAGTVAFVAGRRVGGAVERNRARRILRAGWRQLAPSVREGYDVALVARGAIRGAKTQDLVAEMSELLARAGVASS
jgi:RNase P protein component